jgi:hypothetical protein
MEIRGTEGPCEGWMGVAHLPEYKLSRLWPLWPNRTSFRLQANPHTILSFFPIPKFQLKKS